MKLVVILLAVYTFLESTSYGIYEYQEKKNKARRCKHIYSFHTPDLSYLYLVYYFKLNASGNKSEIVNDSNFSS